jgi:hypothetical protein
MPHVRRMTLLDPPQRPEKPQPVPSKITEATEKDWEDFFAEQENLDYLREFDR